ncbi:MAG TPA: DUF5666 domain-containing protein [Solirubrobacteraceae bacterium]|nr:DUF5666 domain-containing protein [Solirubrobacteraceae bacterium]
MNASSPRQLAAEPHDDYDDGFDEVLPIRPRASYLTPLTALLMALILGGVGFYVGIRVEKSQSSSGGSGATAFGRALTGGALGATGGAGATGSSSKTGSSSRGGLPGASSLASRFAAGGSGGVGGTTGSVSSIDGNTIYVKETDGNTVKVELSSATKISKSEDVSRKKLYPGDSLVVSGSAGSNGTVQATSITDSGASGTSSATASSSTSSARNSSSAISSLFGGG